MATAVTEADRELHAILGAADAVATLAQRFPPPFGPRSLVTSELATALATVLPRILLEIEKSQNASQAAAVRT